MSITEEQTIWFPGIYAGRTDAEYTQLAAQVPMPELIALVARRVKEDGEWTIANGFAAKNEAKMRRMMEFTAKPTNIQQCVEHIFAEGRDEEATVDWACRDLANASKWTVH